MNCRDLNELFDKQSGTALPEAAVKHLLECGKCRTLFAVCEAARTALPSRAVTVSLPEEVLNDLAPVKPLPGPHFIVFYAIVSALLVSAAATAWWGFAGWKAQTTLEHLMLFGTIAAVLFASAYGFSIEMIPGSKALFNWRYLELAGFVGFLITMLIAFQGAYRTNRASFFGECFGRGLLIAAAALPLLFTAIGRGVFVNPRRACITLAVLLSSAALLVLTCYCPILHWRHVLVAHLGAVVVIVVAGALVGNMAE